MKTPKGRTIVIYEPQFDTLQGNQLTGRTACSLQAAGEEKSIYGAFWFNATVRIDNEARTVTLLVIDVTDVKLPDMTPTMEQNFAATVDRELSNSAPTWSLDRTIASIEATQSERAATAKLRNDPPAIRVSRRPAVLIQIDGRPQLRDVSDSDLQRIVNTPYFIVFDPAGKKYYLGSDKYWYQARDPMGPWQVIAKPPPKVLVLKPDDSPVVEAETTPKTGAPPDVIVATQPTELIVIDGEPRFESVPDTDLLHLANSNKDIFKDVASQDYYVLLSGRWYASPTLDGPWNYVRSDRLPASFAKIPEGSEIAHVRSSIAGTPEAEDALRNAQVPQVSAVERSDASLVVAYEGAPKFKSIPGTQLKYAVNTSESVLNVRGKYYACHDAVWYVADDPQGPWEVSDDRPDGVESIPPENPLYHTKYVYVYDSAPNVVYAGYTPGYLGCYPYRGSIVYGTGYYYDPWYGPGYYPHPWTWGLGVTYAPWAGWGIGIGFGTGFLNCGVTWGGYYGWPGYWGGGYYGGYSHTYYGGYYGGSAYCGGGWYGAGGYRPVYPTATTTRYRSTYDTNGKFGTSYRSYDRHAVRDRSHVGHAVRDRSHVGHAVRDRSHVASGRRTQQSYRQNPNLTRSSASRTYADRGTVQRWRGDHNARQYSQDRVRNARPSGPQRGQQYGRSHVGNSGRGAGGARVGGSSGHGGGNRGGGGAPSAGRGGGGGRRR